MKKKIISILMISLFLLTAFVSVNSATTTTYNDLNNAPSKNIEKTTISRSAENKIKSTDPEVFINKWVFCYVPGMSRTGPEIGEGQYMILRDVYDIRVFPNFENQRNLNTRTTGTLILFYYKDGVASKQTDGRVLAGAKALIIIIL